MECPWPTVCHSQLNDRPPCMVPLRTLLLTYHCPILELLVAVYWLPAVNSLVLTGNGFKIEVRRQTLRNTPATPNPHPRSIHHPGKGEGVIAKSSSRLLELLQLPRFPNAPCYGGRDEKTSPPTGKATLPRTWKQLGNTPNPGPFQTSSVEVRVAWRWQKQPDKSPWPLEFLSEGPEFSKYKK